MPLCLFSVYVYNGNEMSMSQIILVSMMLFRIKETSRRACFISELWADLTISFEALQKFFTNPEVQSEIIAISNDEKDKSALKIKGNFSWGFKKFDDDNQETIEK